MAGEPQVYGLHEFVTPDYDENAVPEELLEVWVDNKRSITSRTEKLILATLMVKFLFAQFRVSAEEHQDFAIALGATLATANWFTNLGPMSEYDGYGWVKDKFDTAHLLSLERKQPIFPDAMAVSLNYITRHLLGSRPHEQEKSSIASPGRSAYMLPSLIAQYKYDGLGTFHAVNIPNDFAKKLQYTPVRELQAPQGPSSSETTGEPAASAPARRINQTSFPVVGPAEVHSMANRLGRSTGLSPLARKAQTNIFRRAAEQAATRSSPTVDSTKSEVSDGLSNPNESHQSDSKTLHEHNTVLNDKDLTHNPLVAETEEVIRITREEIMTKYKEQIHIMLNAKSSAQKTDDAFHSMEPVHFLVLDRRTKEKIAWNLQFMDKSFSENLMNSQDTDTYEWTQRKVVYLRPDREVLQTMRAELMKVIESPTSTRASENHRTLHAVHSKVQMIEHWFDKVFEDFTLKLDVLDGTIGRVESKIDEHSDQMRNEISVLSQKLDEIWRYNLRKRGSTDEGGTGGRQM